MDLQPRGADDVGGRCRAGRGWICSPALAVSGKSWRADGSGTATVMGESNTREKINYNHEIVCFITIKHGDIDIRDKFQRLQVLMK